ncbi:hypothetical protein AYL99_03125 [Fonsecaea erecta]|uniref:NADH:flavin oxidoreductase/NADH oxidase N-terminal domain-containing protein n=1 Tax=Fonsecaea erecta TaxID=1367422 RepID=A0A178ZVS9_9EURO|nr:hypothetical protein AYL99_03125 [Fonsecaea erecta]OAP63898.1 hypothetical protein AYL99_03125 [Fonsecaea erecta]
MSSQIPIAPAAPGLNPGVPNLPYFTPAHAVSPGVPYQLTPHTPTLFRPLRIRGKTLRNRIVVSPMCQYSTASGGPQIGQLTDWHVVHLGQYAVKGAAIVFVEATGVQPHGRITPHCPGLWDDAQIESFRRVSDFVKSQGSLAGIQLGHAGRKASTVPPWIADQAHRSAMRATAEVGGWPEHVVGPMGGPENSWDGKGLADDGGFWSPRQLSVSDIQEIVHAFAASARRAVQAGFDVIEIHGAHGYLIFQFLSPITNRRTDQYGGSFENRTRFLREVLQAVRAEIPADMPLFLRISATEWMEETALGQEYGSWDLTSTIKLAALLPSLGVDLLDCSSGGNHPQQRIQMMSSQDYQTKMAAQTRQRVRRAGLKLLIGAVGLISRAEQARDIVEGTPRSEDVAIRQAPECKIPEEAAVAEGMTNAQGQEPMADVIFVARQFLREPQWVLKVAWQLGVDVAWPSQCLKVRYREL